MLNETDMTTIRKTITLTAKQEEWIKAQIASGDFTNESEYLRALIRKDQSERAKLIALKAAIQDGLDSGISDDTLEEIWQDAETRHQNQHA